MNVPGSPGGARARQGLVGSISPARAHELRGGGRAQRGFQGGNAAFMHQLGPAAYAAATPSGRRSGRASIAAGPPPHELDRRALHHRRMAAHGVEVLAEQGRGDRACPLARRSPEAQRFARPRPPSSRRSDRLQQDLGGGEGRCPSWRARRTSRSCRAPRPVTGARANEASIAFFQGVSQGVPQGRDPKEALGQVEQRLSARFADAARRTPPPSRASPSVGAARGERRAAWPTRSPGHTTSRERTSHEHAGEPSGHERGGPQTPHHSTRGDSGAPGCSSRRRSRSPRSSPSTRSPRRST